MDFDQTGQKKIFDNTTTQPEVLQWHLDAATDNSDQTIEEKEETQNKFLELSSEQPVFVQMSSVLISSCLIAFSGREPATRGSCLPCSRMFVYCKEEEEEKKNGRALKLSSSERGRGAGRNRTDWFPAG